MRVKVAHKAPRRIWEYVELDLEVLPEAGTTAAGPSTQHTERKTDGEKCTCGIEKCRGGQATSRQPGKLKKSQAHDPIASRIAKTSLGTQEMQWGTWQGTNKTSRRKKKKTTKNDLGLGLDGLLRPHTNLCTSDVHSTHSLREASTSVKGPVLLAVPVHPSKCPFTKSKSSARNCPPSPHCVAL